MKTSIILCTYNGQENILQQLGSIMDQSVQPDELIIRDDCSTDNTVDLCRQFITNNHLNWKLMVNKANIGWKKNFFYGIKQCKGDIVFLCDQDDVWENTKIQEMKKILEHHTDIELLITNYSVIVENDDNDKYVGQSRRMLNSGTLHEVPFSGRWSYIARPGCTYAFRRTFFEDIEKCWNDDWPHDANLFRFAIIRDSLWLYEKKMIQFRRHGKNQTGFSVNTRTDRIKDIVYYLDVYHYFLEYLEHYRSGDKRKAVALEKSLRWLNARYKALKSDNLLSVLLLIRYLPYYSSIKSWGADVISLLRYNKKPISNGVT